MQSMNEEPATEVEKEKISEDSATEVEKKEDEETKKEEEEDEDDANKEKPAADSTCESKYRFGRLPTKKHVQKRMKGLDGSNNKRTRVST